MPSGYTNGKNPMTDAEALARWQYEYADAMLHRRSLPPLGNKS